MLSVGDYVMWWSKGIKRVYELVHRAVDGSWLARRGGVCGMIRIVSGGCWFRVGGERAETCRAIWVRI